MHPPPHNLSQVGLEGGWSTPIHVFEAFLHMAPAALNSICMHFEDGTINMPVELNQIVLMGHIKVLKP